MEYGIIGLIVIILDIIAIMKVLGSGVSGGKKVVWSLLILFLPVLGLIAWWLAGPKS